MSQKPSYFKIGLFVIIAAALIVVAIVIFGSGLFAEEKIYFETYFDSSVTGLSVGAHVLNSGVVIGQIEKITFARDEYEMQSPDSGPSKYYFYVMVIASVNQENLPDITPEQRQARLKTLIDKGLRLRLATNLLTGKGYLEANVLDPERFPILPITWKPKQLYIPSAPGEFTTIKNSIDQILHKLEQIDIEAIVDNLNKLIEDVDRAVIDADIKTLSTKTVAFIEELRQSNQDLKKLLENPDPEEKLASIPQAVDKLDSVLKRIDKLLVSKGPHIEDSIGKLREITADLKDLTNNLKKNPSQLIFSKPPPESEVLK